MNQLQATEIDHVAGGSSNGAVVNPITYLPIFHVPLPAPNPPEIGGPIWALTEP